ncbi:MAG: hypothetical protein NVS2B9_16920 [Myxococcales bacterium]
MRPFGSSSFRPAGAGRPGGPLCARAGRRTPRLGGGACFPSLILLLLGIAPVASGARAETAPAPPAPGLRAFPLDLRKFQVLQRDSGPRNYYRIISDPPQTFIRGVYSPGLDTVTLFTQAPEEVHRGARLLRWRWRALVLPRQGNECVDDRGDGAATVYLTWKRGLRWYTLKFIWSTEARVGATCNGKRSPFVAQDSIILRSGAPTGVWHDEEVDPDALFRQHFEGGDPRAEVPDLAGVGILTDGDQTHSVSAADYAGFVLYK